MKIVNKPITISELKKIAKAGFGSLVKAVVDTEKGIMAVDGELHADEEALLIENGSRQQALWGINIYPDLPINERIEFDSMINLRPASGNLSRGVDDPKIRGKIIKITDKLIGR
jgi:hypothetical protein